MAASPGASPAQSLEPGRCSVGLTQSLALGGCSRAGGSTEEGRRRQRWGIRGAGEGHGRTSVPAQQRSAQEKVGAGGGDAKGA